MTPRKNRSAPATPEKILPQNFFIAQSPRTVFAVLLVGLALASFFVLTRSHANPSDNARGYAAVKDLGYISMNCYNSLILDGTGTPEDDCTVPYGTKITPNGTFSGLAWGENTGWICWGATCNGTLLPGGVTLPSNFSAAVSLTGATRGNLDGNATSGNGGYAFTFPNSGAIQLSGTATDGTPFGVFVNASTSPTTNTNGRCKNDDGSAMSVGPGEFCGLAWNQSLGFIDFRRVTIVPLTPNKAPSVTQLDPNPATEAIPDGSGIISRWRLDGDAKDSVGANNGTLSGAPVVVPGATSATGSAYQLNGSTDAITVPRNTNLEPQAFSITAWVKLNAAVLDAAIVSKGMTQNFGYALTMDHSSGGYRACIRYNSSGTWIIACNPKLLTLGTFYHLAVTYDGYYYYTIYVNGIGATGYTYTIGTVRYNTDPVRIGSGGTTGYFNGVIDDVHLYGQALSSAEVNALRSSANASITPTFRWRTVDPDNDPQASAEFVLCRKDLNPDCEKEPLGPTQTISGYTQVGTYAALTQDGAGGTKTLTVDTTAGFAPYDNVVIHQTRASVQSEAGKYEFNTISALTPSTLTLVKPLTRTYTRGSNDAAQVVRMEPYTNLTIASGGFLTAPAWNGKGGILALNVKGTLTINSGGVIDMSGKGFGGGGADCSTSGPTHTAAYNGGTQGDSWNGPGGVSCASNQGGGGGGDGVASYYNPDPNIPNLIYPRSGETDLAASGGGGGHGTDGVTGNSGVGSQCSGHAGGGGSYYGNEFPDTYTEPNGTLLLPGSGGGGGGGNQGWAPLYGIGSCGGVGGAGGGIVMIVARSTAGTGTIRTNGSNAGSGGNVGGGGGAGGSIWLAAPGSTPFSLLAAGGVSTNPKPGGAGGSGNTYNTTIPPTIGGRILQTTLSGPTQSCTYPCGVTTIPSTLDPSYPYTWKIRSTDATHPLTDQPWSTGSDFSSGVSNATNDPPTAIALAPNPTTANLSQTPTFSWASTDPEGDAQAGAEIVLCKKSINPDCENDTTSGARVLRGLIVPATAESCTYPCGVSDAPAQLDTGTMYTWKVRVSDAAHAIDARPLTAAVSFQTFSASLNYGVGTFPPYTGNSAPAPINLGPQGGDRDVAVTPTFQWTTVDPDSDPQTAAEVVLCKTAINPDCENDTLSGARVLRGLLPVGSSQSCLIGCGVAGAPTTLQYGTAYNWKLRVSDAAHDITTQPFVSPLCSGVACAAGVIPKFTTRPHERPVISQTVTTSPALVPGIPVNVILAPPDCRGVDNLRTPCQTVVVSICRKAVTPIASCTGSDADGHAWLDVVNLTQPPAIQNIQRGITFGDCSSGQCNFAMHVDVNDGYFPTVSGDLTGLNGIRRMVPRLRRINPF